MIKGAKGRNNQAGFTVVELLVALTLFSLPCTLLFGNVRFGLKAWEHGLAHTERVDHSKTVQNLLRRIIGEVYPLFVMDDPTHPHVDFVGAENALAFIGPAPSVAGRGSRYRFVLAADRHEAKTDLVMTAQPELAEDRSSATRNPLLTDVEHVELSYFGRVPSENAARWHDKWAQQSMLPQLVRIQVRFHAGDTRLWPELVVAPRIYADVSCVYDALTKRCRGR
jgi:general secretion pathway protein J